MRDPGNEVVSTPDHVSWIVTQWSRREELRDDLVMAIKDKINLVGSRVINHPILVKTLHTWSGLCSRSTLVPILVPRGRAPFCQHQEPLAWSNDIPVLNGFVNTIDWDQNQSDLSDMLRVMGSPWIVDFRLSWTWPEVAILGADQKECSLWGPEWLVAHVTLADWKNSLFYISLSAGHQGFHGYGPLGSSDQ